MLAKLANEFSTLWRTPTALHITWAAKLQQDASGAHQPADTDKEAAAVTMATRTERANSSVLKRTLFICTRTPKQTKNNGVLTSNCAGHIT